MRSCGSGDRVRLGHGRAGSSGCGVGGIPEREESPDDRLRPDRLARGLAAWITEKLIGWADPRIELSRDAILDNLMHYWLRRTAASSARLYWESLLDVTRWLEGPLDERDHVDAPAGCSVFPYELQRPSRRWADLRFGDIVYWNEPERGVHFAALEQPALFVAEVTTFFALVR